MKVRSYLSIIFLIISIANLNAQDYTLSFNGAGASHKVDTVIIRNVTQGKTMILKGSTVLHLKGDTSSVTAIDPLDSEPDNELSFSPNPMDNFSLMKLYLPRTGTTIIELVDVSGHMIAQTREDLTFGLHLFRITNLKSGIYLVRARAPGFLKAGKLLSANAEGNEATIVYQGRYTDRDMKVAVKSTSTDEIMQYNSGDTLLMTFISDEYKSTVSEIPEETKAVTCNFYECRDYENKNYPVVQIGNQIWMAENLGSTIFNDGTIIQNVTDPVIWRNQVSSAYCWYDNDSAQYARPYGALYNWHSVNTGKLCPVGWHVPSSDEWETLINYLGDYSLVGGKLKEEGTNHWKNPNVAATNSTGFSGLSGGIRYGPVRDEGGGFGSMSVIGDWWSATEFDDTLQSWHYSLGADLTGVGSGLVNRKQGLSVRCIGPVIPLPKVMTDNIIEITSTTAECGGTIDSDNSSTITERGVCWSLNPDPNVTDNKTIDDNVSTSFTCSISGLLPNTVYYIRAYATNNSGTGYGRVISFKTKHENSGFVTDVDGNEYDTIIIGDQIWMKENLKTTRYNDGTSILKARNGEYSNEARYQWIMNDSANFKATYGALYNWYVVAEDKICPDGWHVPTNTEWSMLETYLGGSNVAGGKMKEAGTEHWLDPNTGADNSSGFSALPGTVIGTSEFFWTATEIFGVCAWARNLQYSISSINGDYMGKQGFMNIRCMKYPDQHVPILVTNIVDSITQTKANSGGFVVYDGGSQVTSLGVCWSTDPNPQITDNKTIEAYDSNDYLSILTGLTPHTTYYIKAYATNEFGTGYGNEYTFTTLAEFSVDSIFNADSIVDTDGNIYKTVKIGQQIWMAENLKTTKYNTGDNIPQVADNNTWGSLNTGAYCWYNNDSAGYEKVYGKLYNWYTVNTGNLCPIGWHVPSEVDWDELINFLGGSTLSGGKMKEEGFEHWPSPNTDADNGSGFSALPGGYRFPNGSLFSDVPYTGLWFSSSLNESENPLYIELNYATALCHKNWYDKKAGMSVRCVGPKLPAGK
jgi:uncharacterized protein (TIGR02145 family)